MTHSADEDLYCRLKDLSRALPRWLETDRQALLDGLIAQLLPLEADDLEDLFRDRDIEQWPRFLLAGGQWPETMRHIVLSQIEPKERRQS